MLVCVHVGVLCASVREFVCLCVCMYPDCVG